MSGAVLAGLGERERAAVQRVVDGVVHASKAHGTTYAPSAPSADDATVPGDVVVAFVDRGEAGRSRLEQLARTAGKALVVVLANPERGLAGVLPRRGEAAASLELRRLLWSLGRVRAHVYLVFPRAVEAYAAAKGQVVAPDVAHAPVGALVRRWARLQAYVLDVEPRSPQARRRLRLSGGSRVSGGPA